MSTCRRVRFFALGLLFASLAPQIEARKHSGKKTIENSNLRLRLKQMRVCKFFSTDQTSVRVKLTAAIMNSPGKLLRFIGSLAANSRSRLHLMQKAMSLRI